MTLSEREKLKWQNTASATLIIEQKTKPGSLLKSTIINRMGIL